MIEGNCNSCVFYIDDRCKRYPPQIGLMHPGNKGISQLNDWPIVREDDWCGEYNIKVTTGLNS